MPFSMHRRAVLQAGVAAIVAASLPANAAKPRDFFGRRGIPIGLQLYTVADTARTALEATMIRVAAIGYESLELAGYHGHTPTQLRAAADKAGLKLTSIHVGADSRPGEPSLNGDIPKLAAELHGLGVTDVVMPMFAMPTRFDGPAQGEGRLAYLERVTTQITASDWQQTAAQLNTWGSAFRKEGLRFGYHNHNPEFAPLPDGKTGFDILLQETDAESVKIEMDIGWVAAAGVDPVALLHKHRRRVTQLHVKDIRATTRTNYALAQDPTEVGNGRIDWPALLKAADRAGIKRYYVEQEPPFPGDRFDSIDRSLKYLKSLG
jgi:sugar phosphate isomerase/epimerase